MIEHRHQLARLCVETYQRDPADEPELRKLATEALSDKSQVEALLSEGAVPLGANLPPNEEKASDLKSEISNLKSERAKRVIVFLKAQQQADGSCSDSSPAIFQGGISALCVAALLQAGVAADDVVIQKALAMLRKIEPNATYTVALQTMVFCAASPKEDAELIRRRIAWLEKAQIMKGPSRGGWSYRQDLGGACDGSNSRFAVMGLHAAKRAGFDVPSETWERVSDDWVSTLKDQKGWGYSTGSEPSISMTLAGITSLSAAHRYLSRDNQAEVREAAIRRPAEFVEKGATGISHTGTLYTAQCLERAGHLSGMTHFGKLDWKTDMTKRLLDAQKSDGHWQGKGVGESNELIATSLALLALTGQPEPKLVSRQLRIEPRDNDKPIQIYSERIEKTSPQVQRTVISGGVRIEVLEPNGTKWRIEADRAVIESDPGVDEKFELNPANGVSRIACIGSVKYDFTRDGESTKVIAENLVFDVVGNEFAINTSRKLP